MLMVRHSNLKIFKDKIYFLFQLRSRMICWVNQDEGIHLEERNVADHADLDVAVVLAVSVVQIQLLKALLVVSVFQSINYIENKTTGEFGNCYMKQKLASIMISKSDNLMLLNKYPIS